MMTTTCSGYQDEKRMKPKSKGAGIMVSEFIDEHNGFLAILDDEYSRVKTTDPDLPRKGYWTGVNFVE